MWPGYKQYVMCPACDQHVTHVTVMWPACDCSVIVIIMQPMCNQCLWNGQLQKPLIIHPSTIHNFPNVNATEFHIEVKHKSYVVGNNHTLLFAAQGEASFGRNVRKGGERRRVEKTVEWRSVKEEGRRDREERKREEMINRSILIV